MLRKSCFCSNCGTDIGSSAFCCECGTPSSSKQTLSSSRDTLISADSSSADKSHYASLQGVSENKRAVGGAVKTWRPATEAECAAKSDAMADKVMDMLAGLPQIGSQKTHTIPNWQKGRVGATVTTTSGTETVTTTKVGTSGGTLSGVKIGSTFGKSALDAMPPKQSWKMN